MLPPPADAASPPVLLPLKIIPTDENKQPSWRLDSSPSSILLRWLHLVRLLVFGTNQLHELFYAVRHGVKLREVLALVAREHHELPA